MQHIQTPLLPLLRRAEGYHRAGLPLLLRYAADGETESLHGTRENGAVQVQLQPDVQLVGKVSARVCADAYAIPD